MQILQKTYAALTPAGPELVERLRLVVAAAQRAGFCPGAEPEDIIALQGDTLLISYEGMAFPLEDVVVALEGSVLTGKLDFLDLEAWTLTRHIWKDGHMMRRTGDLNAALESKGF